VATYSNSGTATAIAVDLLGNVYFTYRGANAANSNVIVYGASDTTPTRTFGNGSLTTPSGIAVGADGTAYVAQGNVGVVTANDAVISVYAAGSTGTQAPSRTLNVAATYPQALVTSVGVDANGVLYVNPVVAGNPAGAPTVAAYAAGASGSQAPARTVTDPLVQLDSTAGLAVMTLGNMFVVGTWSNTVFAYPISSSGTVSPSRRLSYVAASTRGNNQINSNFACPMGLCGAASTYVDSHDNLYVSSFVSNSIQVYPPGAGTPSRAIIGPNTQLLQPQGMVVDAAGNLFVQSRTGTLVFGPAANGDATPLRILNAQGAPAIGPGP